MRIIILMEKQEEFESSNINIRWLENIYDQLMTIQNMERLAREGCNSIMEYVQMPWETRNIILADVEYKNMRLMALEIDIIISNLAPVLKNKIDGYKLMMSKVLISIDNRSNFLKEIRRDNRIVQLETLELMQTTISFLSKVKEELIKDIGHLLYILEKEDNRKKW